MTIGPAASAAQSDGFDHEVTDFLHFIGAERPSANMIFILIMGVTGSGKSSLVQRCTGRNVEIGHGLKSCTNDLTVSSFHHEGYHVHLIDTPGFDDTNRSDIDTLKTISGYLSASYANGVRINGIIYLHRISDNRLGSTALRNLRMFKKLSGASAWPNTAIATTMWRADQHTEGLQRERELMNDYNYIGDLLGHGTNIFRIAEWGTGVQEQRVSALRVISHIIQRTHFLPNIQLTIQRELVMSKKMLDDTAAGMEILGELYHLRRQLTQQLESSQRDMQEALRNRDMESARQLQSVEMEFSRKIRQSERQQAEMKTSLMQMHDAELDRLTRKLEQTESEQRTALARKRRELGDMEASLEAMREQSGIDAARSKRRALDAAASERTKQADAKIDRECEESIARLRKQVALENRHLKMTKQSRERLSTGIAQGLASGVASAAATALIATFLCVIS